MKYDVYFNEILIGHLEINEENNYYYEPVEAEINFPTFPFDFSKRYEWGGPIPFFKNRIDNWNRSNPNSEIFGYFTDPFVLKKVN